MPTILLLDSSLSMARPVPVTASHDGPEELYRHQLAVDGINAVLDYMAVNYKLEFVALVRHFQCRFEKKNERLLLNFLNQQKSGAAI